MPTLFEPIRAGALACPNRIWMAPLTRGRATRDHVPTPLMAEYYAQRASAGLIITEATGISVEGSGWPYAGGLWGAEHVAHWRTVTEAVHAAGGRIVAQLWHMGRLVHPSLHGVQPVSASATTGPGKAHTYDGKQPYVQARPLALEEIPRLIGDYVHAARNAIDAGFDGVQLHAANGYLIDQFLRDGANDRDGAYGGSIEKRARLLFEVVDAVIGVFGAGRTGLRISPLVGFNDMRDSDPAALVQHVAEKLQRRGAAFLDLRHDDFSRPQEQELARIARRHFRGTLMLNGGFDAASGEAAVRQGHADAIIYGKPFISNPDLVQRIRSGAALAPVDFATLYTPGARGYTDYPALVAAEAATAATA